MVPLDTKCPALSPLTLLADEIEYLCIIFFFHTPSRYVVIMIEIILLLNLSTKKERGITKILCILIRRLKSTGYPIRFNLHEVVKLTPLVLWYYRCNACLGSCLVLTCPSWCSLLVEPHKTFLTKSTYEHIIVSLFCGAI
jgi:hypothetical protein